MPGPTSSSPTHQCAGLASVGNERISIEVCGTTTEAGTSFHRRYAEIVGEDEAAKAVTTA
jgi:hypothetical protein